MSLDRALRLLEIYDRVHAELDDGKTFDQIDDGTKKKTSYNYWQAYMQQSILNSLRGYKLANESREPIAEHERQEINDPKFAAFLRAAADLCGGQDVSTADYKIEDEYTKFEVIGPAGRVSATVCVSLGGTK